jgi:hypothetical protein
MNCEAVKVLLDIDLSQDVPMEIVKKQYHKRALQFHPDKNKSADAPHQFRLVQEAYEYAMKYQGYLEDSDMDLEADSETHVGQTVLSSYYTLLNEFLGGILGTESANELQERVFKCVIHKLVDLCESKAMAFLETLDKPLLIKTYHLLEKHTDQFHFTEPIMEKIRSIIMVVETEGDERIILRPLLDDLFADNLYKLQESGATYLVPLWHHELVYDNSGNDLYVSCVPLLPDNVTIDEHNHIMIALRMNVCDIWEKDCISFFLGKCEFSFKKDCLRLTSQCQMVMLKDQGIAKIDTHDMYNVSQRSNIHVFVELFHE